MKDHTARAARTTIPGSVVYTLTEPLTGTAMRELRVRRLYHHFRPQPPSSRQAADRQWNSDLAHAEHRAVDEVGVMWESMAGTAFWTVSSRVPSPPTADVVHTRLTALRDAVLTRPR
jgi:hypothetical protein